MASSSADMKKFYKQRKKNSEISKPKSKSKNAASCGSSVTQPPALVAHGGLDLKGDYDAGEEVLRQFDMNIAYGPCIGMNRLDRWKRAASLGLNPPENVHRILTSAFAEKEKVRFESLWDGLV